MHPILNIDAIEYRPSNSPPGTRRTFDAKVGLIGPHIGAQKLGYNVTVVPPGAQAFPFRAHRVNEEMLFILEGSGEVRIGNATHPIRQSDVIACPPGGFEAAHQIVNTSNADRRYLAVSTKMSPEVVEYPDSGKFGVLAEFPAGADGKPQGLRFISKRDLGLGYVEGE